MIPPYRKGSDMDGKVMSVWIDTETEKRLTKLAAEVGITRNKLAVNLLRIGLDDAELLGKSGVLKLVTTLQGMKGKVAARLTRLAGSEV